MDLHIDICDFKSVHTLPNCQSCCQKFIAIFYFSDDFCPIA